MNKFLNLGCGGLNIPGMFNTDIDEWPGLDMVLDASKVPYPFDDETWDEIVNSHMIEHIEHDKILPMFREWLRILKPGGKVFVDVPDLDEATRKYVAGDYSWDKLLELIYGLQDEREHQRHLWGYSPESLKNLFHAAGFSKIEQVETDDYHLKNFNIPTFRILAIK